MSPLPPGPELDKRVCEIVGITPVDEGYWDHPKYGYGNHVEYSCVSTDLAELEPVLEWLRKKERFLDFHPLSEGWQAAYWPYDDEEIGEVIGETLQHAACLAVVAINEEEKRKEQPSLE